MTKLVYYLLYAISILPFRMLYAISDMIMPLLYYIIRYRRDVVRRNLTSVFPEKSTKEIKSIEKKFYHWFCDYFLEAIKLLSISDEELNRRLRVKNPEVHEQWFVNGRNTAGFLGHYCNWEWLSRVGKDMNPERRLCLIYDPLHSRVINYVFLRLRTYAPTGVPTPKKDILRQLVGWRREGRMSLSGYIADQAPKWENIHLWLPFLNHAETPVFTGAERIVRKMNDVIFYVKMTRPRRGYYDVEYIPITDDPASLPEGEVTRRFFRMLEQSVRKAPEYYLWTHNRWKRTKEEFDRRFTVINGKVVAKKQIQGIML
ncbi:lysophospholipid acyltransferase family protein [Hallella multisaccharivorax]|uniref:lysophospholipid acyltransferase family protein n=1 Tax=Hallella multisaccharivorax TaxID=310514 RepID=UPI0036076B76